MCCVLLKKYFLDVRPASKLTNPDVVATELSAGDLEQLRSSVVESLAFDSQSLSLLKRKCEVLGKIYSKLDRQTDLIQFLVQQQNQADVKCRQFAMYGFEIMSEMHLTSEQLTGAKKDFQAIFEKALVDPEILVRVAALKAITAFVGAIDDQDIVMEFVPILEPLLNTVVKALEADEEQGRLALESLGELTGAHPEVWKANTSFLIQVVSDVATMKSFEPGTRSAAIEVVLSLSN